MSKFARLSTILLAMLLIASLALASSRSRFTGHTQVKGHTLIPTRLYFKNGRVKCELALARGKQDWDKRETERRREADREARAAINASKHRSRSKV